MYITCTCTCMYMYMYMCIHMYVHVHVHLYIIIHVQWSRVKTNSRGLSIHVVVLTNSDLYWLLHHHLTLEMHHSLLKFQHSPCCFPVANKHVLDIYDFLMSSYMYMYCVSELKVTAVWNAEKLWWGRCSPCHHYTYKCLPCSLRADSEV